MGLEGDQTQHHQCQVPHLALVFFRAANLLLRLSHVWVTWSPTGSVRPNHFPSCKCLGQLKTYQYLLQSLSCGCTGAVGDGIGEYPEWAPSTTLANPRKRQSVILGKYHEHQITSGSLDRQSETRKEMFQVSEMSCPSAGGTWTLCTRYCMGLPWKGQVQNKDDQAMSFRLRFKPMDTFI